MTNNNELRLMSVLSAPGFDIRNETISIVLLMLLLLLFLLLYLLFLLLISLLLLPQLPLFLLLLLFVCYCCCCWCCRCRRPRSPYHHFNTDIRMKRLYPDKLLYLYELDSWKYRRYAMFVSMFLGIHKNILQLLSYQSSNFYNSTISLRSL